MDSRTFVKIVRSGARAADGSLPAEVWAERETAPTMTSFDNGEVRATVLAVTGGAQQDQFIRPEGVSAPGVNPPGRRQEDDQNLVTVVTQDSCPVVMEGITPALKLGSGLPNMANVPNVHQEGVAGVRRLTPVECERLMGWPDDHTAWGVDEDGNRKDMPDSTRYRMVGNGVMSPVAEWIGNRILEALDA